MTTPLTERHRTLGARLVPFAGWEMPVQYPSGILAEARAVRTTAGLFDVSHMGRIDLEGPGALETLCRLTPARIGALVPGTGLYTVLPNERGGLIDDLMIFCLQACRYALIVNAGNTAAAREWIASHAANAAVTDRTAETALLALQGPRAEAILIGAGAEPAVRIDRFHRVLAMPFGIPTAVMRTGYTGEDGFEIECQAEDAGELWDRIVCESTEPAVPCGLGARDLLRIEAGYPLYGHEIDAECNPWESGLGWTFQRADGYVGADAVQAMKASAGRRQTGLEMETRSVARQGAIVLSGDRVVGEVTSGTFSPNRNASIALARIDRAALDAGESLSVESGGRRQVAKVVPVPFVELPRPRRRTTSHLAG